MYVFKVYFAINNIPPTPCNTRCAKFIYLEYIYAQFILRQLSREKIPNQFDKLKACVRKEVVKMNQQYESVLSGKKLQGSPVTVFTITFKPVQATRPGSQP